MEISTIEERFPALHWNETRGSSVQDPSQFIKSEEVLGSLSIVSESCCCQVMCNKDIPTRMLQEAMCEMMRVKLGL